MPDSGLYAGIATALLDKFAVPVVKTFTDAAKNEWERFKVDFGIAFQKYMSNSIEKYGKVKTILYRTEPKPIYDFFECPNLRKNKGELFLGDSIDNLLDIFQFIIIQGMGGVGKSTFLKHLFMDESVKQDLIPIFVELKDLNAIDGDYEISDFLFRKLYDLGESINMQYALQTGAFVFLLDGYDEILSSKQDAFFRKLDSFCDRYSDNHFIISSRPYSEFVEFQRFTVLTLCELTKEQALSLIRRIEFDPEIKERFITALDEKLYEQHKSFASNPLLLSIMLLTFDNYAEIPDKLHLFYANAFETLYSKHDATKAGYRREMHSSLSFDNFKKVFSYFCFISYRQKKTKFTHDEMLSVLKKISNSVIGFDPDNFIFNLENAVCLMHKDGLEYVFSHRSFQEYFSAIFLKELPDHQMQKLGLELLDKDLLSYSFDNVFPMLRDMTEQRFEQNILLPYINMIESECDATDKFRFYFNKILPELYFKSSDCDKSLRIFVTLTHNDRSMLQLLRFANYYQKKDPDTKNRLMQADMKLYRFIARNRNYMISKRVLVSDYSTDLEVFTLFKETSIGHTLNLLAGLKEHLEQKHQSEELDLSFLLDE